MLTQEVLLQALHWLHAKSEGDCDSKLGNIRVQLTSDGMGFQHVILVDLGSSSKFMVSALEPDQCQAVSH